MVTLGDKSNSFTGRPQISTRKKLNQFDNQILNHNWGQ